MNELIQSGDKRLIIAAADAAAVPTTQDRVLISGVSHEVIKIDTIEQDNEPITYEANFEGIAMARQIGLGDISKLAEDELEELVVFAAKVWTKAML